MGKLKEQVTNGLDSINMFRNIHENDIKYVHCHCLAINFYLDHYDFENKDKDQGFYEQES